MLLHGLGANLEAFREYGYVEVLKEKYRLILIDVRGHGASDKPHDPKAYQAKLLVADVVAVLDQLRVEKAHFFGYSMGGGIGFGIAKYAPKRCYSLIIGGNHPYKPNTDEQAELDSIIQLYKKGKDALVADVEKQLGPKMTPTLRTRLLASDPEAIVAMLSSELSMCSFEEVLSTMKMPCLLYAGDDDEAYSGAKQCVKSMPNATFVSLPGLNHRDAIIQSNTTLPHITKFLEKVSQT